MNRSVSLTICLIATSAVLSISARAEGAHRVKAVLLTKASSLHTSVSNQDVYLLRITPQSGSTFDAIAIDSYPSYAEALPLGRLHAIVDFSVKLIRTPDCDRSFEGQPSIRCFAIDRQSLRLPKSAVTDYWWK